MRDLAVSLLRLLAATAASAAPAPAWVVDKPASSIRFSSSFNGDAFSGAFSGWDAQIHFDPANLAGSSVAASIELASAATGDADRDASLPSPTFFSVARFPRASFVASRFTAIGPGRYSAQGTLTLRGVAKPLTLPFALTITGAQARMTSVVSLNRLAFGVGQDEWRKTDALPAAVKVSIVLVARRR